MGKNFIFDLDGVILDTEVQWKIMWFDFLNNNGWPFTEEDYQRFPGGNWPIFYQELTKIFPNFYGSLEEMLVAYRAYFKDYKIDYVGLAFPHVKDLVVALKERGYRLVIASSSNYEHIKNVTEALEITEYFEFFVSGYDFQQSKPHPQIYLYTASRLQVQSDDCWVLEDSTYGIMSAKSAGMKVIGRRDERFGYDQSSADYLIDDLLEVLEIIE